MHFLSVLGFHCKLVKLLLELADFGLELVLEPGLLGEARGLVHLHMLLFFETLNLLLE